MFNNNTFPFDNRLISIITKSETRGKKTSVFQILVVLNFNTLFSNAISSLIIIHVIIKENKVKSNENILISGLMAIFKMSSCKEGRSIEQDGSVLFEATEGNVIFIVFLSTSSYINLYDLST